MVLGLIVVHTISAPRGQERTDVRSAIRFAAVFLALAASTAALADDEAFNCGQRLIQVGASSYKVREACGDPTQDMGDQWVYVRPGRFTLIVHFDANQAVASFEERAPE
jgi:hypothetical protein